MDNRSAYMYVLFGAALWGMIGLFIEALSAAGFSALQIVTLRVVSASVMLIAYLGFTNRSLLRIHIKDSLSFIGTGIFSIVFFNWCYFTAIEEVSLSIAVILLYTGPVFVALLSWLLFNEPMTVRKIGSLLLTLVGCALVIRMIPMGDQHISLFGFLVGLGAGFGYALYSIFGKHALKKYHPLTVITYTFVFASVVMIPISGFSMESSIFQSTYIWMNIAGLGFFPTALAYLLYTKGLAMIESSRASIMATIEPVVAMLLGVLVFDDILTSYQLLGIVLVLAAVVIIQRKNAYW